MVEALVLHYKVKLNAETSIYAEKCHIKSLLGNKYINFEVVGNKVQKKLKWVGNFYETNDEWKDSFD